MNKVYNSGQFKQTQSDEPCTPKCASPCADCGVRQLSICAVLDDFELAEFASIQSSFMFDAHCPIVSEGDPAKYFFNVTEGAVVLYKLLPDGRRQITGFLLPGDFMGIAATDVFVYSAEALVPSRLCRFPRDRFVALLDRIPKLERRLLSMASHELAEAQEQMLLLGRKTAKERLCSFLLALSRRAGTRGGDARLIAVPMSRADIGDYLGLTTETVSRNFTLLKTTGVVQLREGGNVYIAELDRLAEMAEES